VLEVNDETNLQLFVAPLVLEVSPMKMCQKVFIGAAAVFAGVASGPLFADCFNNCIGKSCYAYHWGGGGITCYRSIFGDCREHYYESVDDGRVCVPDQTYPHHIIAGCSSSPCETAPVGHYTGASDCVISVGLAMLHCCSACAGYGVVNREGVHVLQNSDDCRAAALMPASDISRKLDSTVGKKQYVRVSDAGLKRW